MDYGRAAELDLRIRHQHSDGTWGTFEPRSRHDPAELDPERDWGAGTTVWACAACDDAVVVDTANDPDGRPA